MYPDAVNYFRSSEYKMTSLISYKAQPLTRAFVITQGYPGSEQSGVYYFSTSDIDAWYAANSGSISKVGGLYTITGDFGAIMDTLDNTDVYDGRKTLLDFGKEYIFGNTVNSRLLVLRRVQFWADAAVGGAGGEGFVVVENNTNELAADNEGRFTVRVARI